jgi:hypothetical protein
LGEILSCFHAGAAWRRVVDDRTLFLLRAADEKLRRAEHRIERYCSHLRSLHPSRRAIEASALKTMLEKRSRVRKRRQALLIANETPPRSAFGRGCDVCGELTAAHELSAVPLTCNRCGASHVTGRELWRERWKLGLWSRQD